MGGNEKDDFEPAPLTIEEVLQKAMIGDGVTLVFAEAELPAEDEPTCARLWTSSLRRTIETAGYIKSPVLQLANGKKWKQMNHRAHRNLDEVYAGEYEGLTYEEIKRRDPEEAKLRKLDKLGYRYPRGESYYDIIARLDDIVRQLETYQEPILIISHQAVLRLLYAFLVGIPREQ